MPQELEVWYIIPEIRRELVDNLIKLGLKKSEIAEKFKLTRAAVTQYSKEKRGKNIVLPIKIKKEIELSAKNIFDGSCVISEIQYICDIVKKNKVLCKLHKTFDDTCSCCEVCLK